MAATDSPVSRAGDSERRSGASHSDWEPIQHQGLHVAVNATVAILPFLLLGLVAWQLWQTALGWHDLVVFILTYIPIGLGVTVGFHRLFTHRSFKTSAPVRFILGALGSAALEGPVISWVADHRKHHAFADREGDPHSPHVDHGGGLMGPLRGLWHAHLGWTLLASQRGLKTRYAPDLLKDPTTVFIDRTMLVWVVGGLAFPFGLGWLLSGGSIFGALTGLLWGGIVRIFVLHHVTFSINSLCHVFGRRRFNTRDESTNLAWLAPLSLGEAWHNNHHAFPTSAAHGLSWREFDLSALVIRGMERLGLAWDVVRISPERIAARSEGEPQVPA